MKRGSCLIKESKSSIIIQKHLIMALAAKREILGLIADITYNPGYMVMI
jgi:hypothetical protein